MLRPQIAKEFSDKRRKVMVLKREFARLKAHKANKGLVPVASSVFDVRVAVGAGTPSRKLDMPEVLHLAYSPSTMRHPLAK